MLAISPLLGTSSLVSLDMPPAFSDRVVNALKADARTVDLRSLAPHFYLFATRCLDIFDEDEMIGVLTDVSPPFHPLLPLRDYTHRFEASEQHYLTSINNRH